MSRFDAGIRQFSVLKFRESLSVERPGILSTTHQSEQYDEALAHFRAGEAGAAIAVCNDGLRADPADANLLCLAAKANIILRDFDEVKRLLDEAVRLHPDFATAHGVVGDFLFAQGYVGAAVKAYEQALRLDPTDSSVLSKIEKAQELIKKAGSDGPEVAASAPEGRRMAFADEIGKARQLSKDGDSKQAEDIYRGILKRDPNHVEAARLLAGIAMEKNRYRDAVVFLRHAAEIAPDYVRIWVDLSNAYRAWDKVDESLEMAAKVLELAPETAESHMIYAAALGILGRQKEAIESYENALKISPNRPVALCGMGHLLKTVGDQQRAIDTYRTCMELKPDHAEAYWSLANFKTFQFSDAEISTMYSLLDGDEIPDESRVQFNNALGLDRESRGDFDTAFSHFQQCNSLRRKSESYDPVENEASFDRNIEIFDKDLLLKHASSGHPDTSPIFVVGLPRSGSTLIEQILASHSLVDGTHELPDLSKIVQGIRRSKSRNNRFPDVVADLTPEGWRKIGQDYIASTQRYRDGGTYFIDKNPNNFMLVGLLRLALPNAKIINARRHPLDSCFGSYKQLFAAGQTFTYDLVELGEYYLQYSRLMEHLHQIAPDFVLDVHYEQVVGDLETQVRRMLDFCGLPFEDACLKFHETDRAVKTASSEQVRKPIYKSSVNLWRNYETHLGDLIEVLKPQLDQLPDENQPSSL